MKYVKVNTKFNRPLYISYNNGLMYGVNPDLFKNNGKPKYVYCYSLNRIDQRMTMLNCVDLLNELKRELNEDKDKDFVVELAKKLRYPNPLKTEKDVIKFFKKMEQNYEYIENVKAFIRKYEIQSPE
jgi:hypothetical protein